MSRVVLPPHPGVLSALGLAAAPERVDVLASLHRSLVGLRDGELTRAFEPLRVSAAAALGDAALTEFADCRFAGQGYEVTVPASGNDTATLAAAFRAAHRARHGYADSEQPVELVNLRVVAERPVALSVFGQRKGGEEAAMGRRTIVTRDGKRVKADVWSLGEISTGSHINGPAILAGPDATALIEPGWRGIGHASGAVIVERV